MKRSFEQISVKVANTQMRHLRVEGEKGFTRTVKGSDSVAPKGTAKSEGQGLTKKIVPLPPPKGNRVNIP